MGKIGEGLWFELDLDKSKFDKAIKDVENQVIGLNRTLKLDVDKASIKNKIDNAIGTNGRTIKININANAVQSQITSMKNLAAKIGVDQKYLYQQIQAALDRKKFTINVTTKGHINVDSSSIKNAASAAEDLQKKFLKLFAVDAAQKFLTSIVQIGGEIEKQKLALGAIVGDTSLADKLYGKLANLSMISPFDVGDIMKYSKQLSAFGIQYNDLYDTTKRLADIAAGVGVDFGRIAYEFGQTSSRGHLDARELRMFANSGIPLLKKLSDYYTQLQGMKITTGQVRGMITNREVSFEDVRNVLWEMTDKGGEFYQMQEVMAESLAAKWRNLGNAWNLMLADMAEGATGGALKLVADILTVVVKNAGAAQGAFFGLGIAVAAWRASLTSADIASQTFFKKLKTGIVNLWSTSIKAFAAFMTNPFVWVGAAVAGITALYGHIREANKAIDEMNKKLAEQSSEGLRNLNETIKSNPLEGIGEMTTSSLKDAVAEMKEEVKKYDPFWQGTLKEIFKYSEAEGDYVHSLAERYTLLVEALKETRDAYQDIMDTNDVDVAAWDKATGGSFLGIPFDETFTQDLEDFVNSYNNMTKTISGYNTDVIESQKEFAEAINRISVLNQADDSSPEYIKRRAKAWQEEANKLKELTTIGEKWAELQMFFATDSGKDIVVPNDWFGAMGDISSLQGDYKEVMQETEEFSSNIAGWLQSNHEDLSKMTKGTDEFGKKAEEVVSKLEKRKIMMAINAALDKAGIQEGWMRDAFVNNIWNKVFRVDVVTDYKDLNIPEPTAYQKVVSAAIPKVERGKDPDSGEILPRQLSAQEQAAENMQNIIMHSRDAVELAEALQKKYDGIIKSEKAYVGEMKAKADKEGRGFSEKDLEEAKAEYQRIVEINKYEKQYAKDIAAAGGINLQTKGKSGGGTSDAWLKEKQSYYRRLKAVWDNYKLLAQTMNDDEAWDKVKSGELWESLFPNSEGRRSDYVDAIKSFQDEIKDAIESMDSTDVNYETRRNFWASIFKDMVSMDNDILKPEIQQALASIQQLINDEKDKYDLARAIFDATGASEYASSFVSTVKSLFEGKIKDGIDPMSLLGKSKNELRGFISKPEYIDAVEQLVKTLSSAIKEENKEINDAYSKMLSESEHFMQRRNGIEDEYNRKMLETQDETQRKVLQSLKEWKQRELSEGMFSNLMGIIEKGGVSRVTSDWAKTQYAQRVNYMKSESFAKLPISEQNKYAEETRKLSKLLSGTSVSFKQLKEDSNAYSDAIKNVIEAQKRYQDIISKKNIAFNILKNAEDKYGKDSVQYQLAKESYDNITIQAERASVEADDATSNANAASERFNTSLDAMSSNLTDVNGIISAVKSGSLKGVWDALGADIQQKIGSGVSKLFSKTDKLAKATDEMTDGVAAAGEASGNIYGMIIGAILSMIDTIGDEGGVAILDAFADNVAKAFKTMGDELGKKESYINPAKDLGNIVVSAVDGVLNGITFGGFDKWLNNGDSDKTLAEDMERLTNVNSQLIYAVKELTTIMSDQTNQEAVKTYAKIQDNLVQKQANLQEQMMRSAGAYSNGILGFGGSHSSNSYIDSNLSKADWKAVSKAAGVAVNSASDFWKLTSEQMWNVATYAEAQYAMIKQYADDGYKDAAQYMDEYVEIWKEAKDAFESYFEAMTGLTYNEVYDSFVDMIKDMDSTSEDFANNFEEYLFNAIVNAMSTETIKPLMENWQKEFASAMEDGNVDEIEYANLKNLWDEMVQKGQVIKDIASDASGYAGELSSSGLSSTIKGVTEETADLLSAYINSMRSDLSVNREVIGRMGETIETNIPKLSIIAESQLTQLGMIAENTRLNAEYALMAADAAEEISSTLRDVTSGIKKFSIE